MIVKLLAEHNLEFLSLTGDCRGSSESTHVKMPHCWKSHVAAHLGLDARKPGTGVCRQQRRRPACAYARSDQRLHYSLIGKYHI